MKRRVVIPHVLLALCVCVAPDRLIGQESASSAGDTRRNLPITFPTGVDEVKVPLARGRSRLFSKAHVNGEDAGFFLIDTGAVLSVVGKDVADRFRLKPSGKTTVRKTDGVYREDVTILDRLQVGPLEMRHLVARMDNHDNSGGVLGMDVLGRGPFTLDFQAATLTLYHPERFVPPTDGQELPLRPFDDTPVVQGAVEGRTGWFEIDTCQLTGWHSHSFVRLYPELTEGQPRITEGTPWDEPVEVYGTWWESSEVLGKTFAPSYGYYHTREGGREHLAGGIATNVLQDARLTVDMRSHRCWVEWLEPQPLDQLLARLGGPESRDLDGVPPILQAALALRADAVKALLARGDDPDAADGAGITPLMVASGRGDPDSAAALLAKGARLDARSRLDGYTPLVFAAQYGRTELVAMLLEAKANVDLPTLSGRTPLFQAADADRVPAVTLLLERGAKVDSALPTGETPLIAACRNGSAACVEVLLSKGADANARGAKGTPLTYAAASGSVPCVKLLLGRGADPNRPAPAGLTPLMLAAGAPKGSECVKHLLAAGADAAVKDSKGRTAFDHAVSEGRPDSIRLLVTGKTEAPAGTVKEMSIRPPR